MKNKLYLFLMSIITMIVLNANVEAAAFTTQKPMFFANPMYNIANLRVIKVTEIVDKIPYRYGRTEYDMSADKVMAAIYEGAKKSGMQVIDVRKNGDIDVMMKAPGNVIVGAYLAVAMRDLTYSTRIEPGYWNEVTEYEEREWYDSYGKKHTEKIPHVVNKWVPEQRYTDAHVSLEYKLFDGDNGDVYASSSDTRDRENCENPGGMLRRSAESFFKSIKKTKRLKY